MKRPVPVSLIDPKESLERQNERLLAINDALMRRVEQEVDGTGAAYAQFERAVMLEDQVRQRTRELESALELLNQSNAQLSEANRQIEDLLGVTPTSYAYPCGETTIGRGHNARSFIPLIARHFQTGRGSITSCLSRT